MFGGLRKIYTLKKKYIYILFTKLTQSLTEKVYLVTFGKVLFSLSTADIL